MSALRVAAQRGTTWPKLPVAAVALALTIGLVAGVAVGATVAGRATTQSGISTTPTTPAARTHAAGGAGDGPDGGVSPARRQHEGRGEQSRFLHALTGSTSS